MRICVTPVARWGSESSVSATRCDIGVPPADIDPCKGSQRGEVDSVSRSQDVIQLLIAAAVGPSAERDNRREVIRPPKVVGHKLSGVAGVACRIGGVVVGFKGRPIKGVDRTIGQCADAGGRFLLEVSRLGDR